MTNKETQQAKAQLTEVLKIDESIVNVLFQKLEKKTLRQFAKDYTKRIR